MVNEEEDQGLDGSDGHSQERILSEQIVIRGNYTREEGSMRDSMRRMGNWNSYSKGVADADNGGVSGGAFGDVQHSFSNCKTVGSKTYEKGLSPP